MHRFVLFFASNAGLGYAPVASGTVGTLAGLPIYYLSGDWPWWLYLLTWLGLLGFSF
ncbi:MAG: phosphatidylglycerophosphatase A, partial [Deltaproteobacteria bacterium]|nr:phosphatidylglycerophosphatase A [Deltaproteobacteria bacterium]